MQIRSVLLFRLLFLSLFFFICLNNISANTDIDNEKFTMVKEMGDYLWSIREVDSEKALSLGLQAIDSAKKYKVNDQLARISNFVGVLYIHYLYDTKSAVSYFHQSVEVSLNCGDSISLAFAYNNLADVFLITKNVPLAMEYTNYSLNIFRRLKHTEGIAYGHINLGTIYRETKEYQKALDADAEAIRIRSQFGDDNGIASALLSQGNTFLLMNNLNKAEELFKNSYEHHIRINNYLYTANSLNGLAKVYSKRGDFNKALEYLLQAQEYYTDRNYAVGLFFNCIEIAIVYAHLDNNEKGEKMLARSLEYASLLSMKSIALESYKYSAEFYKILGDYKRSSESLDKYLMLYEEELSNQQFESMNELQKNFNAKIELENATHEIETKAAKELYFQIIISLMVVLISFVIWRYVVARKRRRELQLSNATKDKLFSVISHDLKSPYNTLLGFTEELKTQVDEKYFENVSNYAGIIYQSAEQNLGLLNNLLNWSRSQTGKITFNPELNLLETLFDELEGFYRKEAERLRINLKFASLVEKEIVYDIDILRIILNNLISNALKYTAADATVRVLADVQKEKLVISVIDEGIGIPQSELEHLFETEHAISKVGLRNEKGTGLGLMICNELIQFHKGRIIVDSKVGVGSTFSLIIPLIKID